MRSLATLLVVAALAIGSPSVFAAPLTPVLVDTCGQVVPEKSAAYLSADLDCSAHPGPIDVSLGKKATFDLGGFTLTTGSLDGIRCDEGRCTIRNGTVDGNASLGIVAVRSLIENVAVHLGGLAAVSVQGGTIRGSTITGTAVIGVHSSGDRRVVSIVASTISGHGTFGVWAPRVKLVDSTVTGNLNASECIGDDTCADLMTAKRPKLKNSTCGRSQTLPENPFPGCLGWCICSDD